MDKTLEIVVAAAVIVVIGAIAAYMVNSEASSFSDFIGGQTDRAECQKYQGDNQQAFDANNCRNVLEEGFDGTEISTGPTSPDSEQSQDGGGPTGPPRVGP
jgi:hypothetical protein